MKLITPTSPRQRGTVLVTVLMMFAIAAFIATEMAYRQKFDIRRTGAMLTAAQTREFLGAAESLALYALNDDLRQDEQRNGSAKSRDNLTERWAKPFPPFPVDGGSVQGTLVDAQGKFNVNWLVLKDNENSQSGFNNGSRKFVANKTAIDAFSKLIGTLYRDFPQDMSAEVLASRVTDWIDSDDIPEEPSGFEDTEYLRADIPRRPPNAPMRDITEIRSIEGMTLEIWLALEPYITALPPDTTLNPFTASPEVLAAIGVSPEWVVGRGSGQAVMPTAEADASFIVGELGKDCVEAAPEKQGTSQVKTRKFSLCDQTRYFELHGTARLGGRVLQSRSILYRPRTPGKKGDKLKVIYRRFVDPMTPPPQPTMTINGAPS